MAEKKKLHGNQARVDPEKKIEGMYATNAVTISNRKERETPLVDDENVSLARDFSMENKK